MRSRTASVVVLALVAVACGGEPQDPASDAPPPGSATVEEPASPPTEPTPPAPPGESTAPASPVEPAAPSAEVPELLDFVADGVEGGQVVGAEFAGQALAMWFWAPW